MWTPDRWSGRARARAWRLRWAVAARPGPDPTTARPRAAAPPPAVAAGAASPPRSQPAQGPRPPRSRPGKQAWARRAPGPRRRGLGPEPWAAAVAVGWGRRVIRAAGRPARSRRFPDHAPRRGPYAAPAP